MAPLPTPTPSKKSIRRLRERLLTERVSDADRQTAYQTLIDWRNAHYGPTHKIFSQTQRRVKRLGLTSPIVVMRLKRTPSILAKLKRHTGMQLDRMQDVGGVRAILQNVNDVKRLHAAFTKGRLAHERFPSKDYIQAPKDDGYRGIHQVFKVRGQEAFEGMLVELQIRTKLQHCWATAVETLGVIEKSSFKTGEGEEKFKRFFQLSSALFSIEEKAPIIKSLRDLTPQAIARELVALEKELGVFSKLEGFALAINEGTKQKKQGLTLFILNAEKQTLSFITFPQRQADLAQETYALFELKEKDNPMIDIVLVASGDMNDLRKAYPNYFTDTKAFVKALKAITHRILG